MFPFQESENKFKSLPNYLHCTTLFYIERILQIMKTGVSGAQRSTIGDAVALPLRSWQAFTLVMHKEPGDR